MSVSASPVHSIHEYGHGIYKVVTFKGVRDPDNVYFRNGEDAQHYDNKLDNSFSRARNMVLQYALCNPWDYFFTGTGVYVKRVDFNDENQLVPLASAETTTYSPHTVIIPAGDSSFSAGFRLRVTFKYDQLGGVTKTADIISAIQSIPAYDDSALVSAVTTISDQITEQFGEYDSAYAFPNVLHGEMSTQKLYGVLPSSFSEVPDNSDLLYSSSSSIQVYGSLIETSTEGSPDYYYEKCVPG